jgi:hypothetical protein
MIFPGIQKTREISQSEIDNGQFRILAIQVISFAAELTPRG